MTGGMGANGAARGSCDQRARGVSGGVDVDILVLAGNRDQFFGDRTTHPVYRPGRPGLPGASQFALVGKPSSDMSRLERRG